MSAETAGEDDAEHFDPVGTVTLIAIYMTIVVLMWIFTYFIEFLGRGLTIVG
ncbi:cytochrome oxidase [Halorubellus sp. PRR65]|uniref:cytochrome oxidase n=1 Tax=Halorubellus sp. PRR65 TaxID=3098148 RepID=UPI002B263F84|nr:cytochrome oxidase [Halorubellus sp. PRR65]